jgi:hypothetical protein
MRILQPITGICLKYIMNDKVNDMNSRRMVDGICTYQEKWKCYYAISFRRGNTAVPLQIYTSGEVWTSDRGKRFD